jgi:hypothetical protein
MSALRTIGRKLKSIVVVGLIFVSGVIVGGILSGAAVVRDVSGKAFGGGPGPVRKLLIQHAKDGLHLDEDQQHLFWQILTETGVELNTASKPVQPQMAAVIDRAELRLREVLHPEQVRQFDEWMKNARNRWDAALSDAAQGAAKDAPVAKGQ